MASLNLYRCPSGHEQQEWITLARFPVGVPTRITCAACAASPEDPREVVMEFIPEGMRHDLMKEGFSIDVGTGELRLRSLHEIREFERRSQQDYRNGEGQPYNLRQFSQDPSNGDVNTFGDSPREPFSKTNRRGQPYVTRRGFRPED